MKRFFLRPMAAAIGLALAGLAQADDTGITHKISGYATVGAAFTDTDDAEYTGSPRKFTGATKDLDVGVDSRLGLQGVVNFGAQFSFTAQALMIRRGDKDFDVGMEWLYGQYTPIAGIDLRIGRVLVPAFLLSESINVGYAQPWMRAPVEVYGQMSTNTLDGVQASLRHSVGGALLSAQLSTGQSSFQSVVPGVGLTTLRPKPVSSINFSVEMGDWLARMGHTESKLVFGGSAANKDSFSTVGLQYDNGTAVVMTEATQRRGTDSRFHNTAWYVGGGWRFGKFLPMLILSDIDPDATVSRMANTSSTAVSLRYDVASNVAIKAQLTRSNSAGIAFANRNAAITANPKDINVASFGLDFVF